MARDPIVTRFTRVGGGVTTFARACPVSLSRKPLSPGIEATQKTDLSLSRSLVHRQTWRLTGIIISGSIGSRIYINNSAESLPAVPGAAPLPLRFRTLGYAPCCRCCHINYPNMFCCIFRYACHNRSLGIFQVVLPTYF